MHTNIAKGSFGILLGLFMLFIRRNWSSELNTFSNDKVEDENKNRRLAAAANPNFLPTYRAPRILVVITAFSFQHFDAIDDIFSSFRDSCEGGWDVKIVILTAAEWGVRTTEWLRRVLYCYRSDSIIPFEIRKFNESVGRRIVDYSRFPIAEQLDEFDVFVYTEDDIILTFGMLQAWVAETKKLNKLVSGKTIIDKERCGWKFSCRYSVGFIRYSRKHKYGPRNAKDEKEWRTNTNSWVESHVTDKNRLEEEPIFDPICIEGEPYISLIAQPHQGMWILTRDDIIELNSTCQFLTQKFGHGWRNEGIVREYMATLSLYRNTWYMRPPLNCMVSKVVPAERVEVLKIRHYHRSKDSRMKSSSVFDADEFTRAGIAYTYNMRGGSKSLKLDMPSCWNKVKALNSTEEYERLILKKS